MAKILRLFLLDLLIMGALLAVAGLVMAAGIDMPETALAGIELAPAIILAVVVVAPLTEEIAFRGWLSGRPGHLLALLILGVTLLVASTVVEGSTLPQAATSLGLVFAAGAGLALLALYLLRRRDALPLFQRLFPLFYWLSVLAFACVHLLNFPPAEMAMALPLVLPQFATGTILGYARVRYGLWTSMLLHALHNGAFISLVLLATRAG